MTTWASTDDILTLTGKTVSGSVLAQAQAIIEDQVGRTADGAAGRLRASDLRWLNRAVAYQAAWMTGRPDLFTQMEVENFSQDGAQVNLTDDGQILAPLARRALKRLSWRGNRSVHTPVARHGRFISRPDAEGVVAVLDYTDAYDTWKPL